jgi:hypothetical protein
MKKVYIKDEDFIEIWRRLGSPSLVGAEINMPPRAVMNKRSAIECKYNIKLETHNSQRDPKKERPKK